MVIEARDVSTSHQVMEVADVVVPEVEFGKDARLMSDRSIIVYLGATIEKPKISRVEKVIFSITGGIRQIRDELFGPMEDYSGDLQLKRHLGLIR